MEDIEVSSDDLSSGSGRSFHTPPRKKREWPKRAHGKLHKGKALKIPSKGRKRKYVQSSSSVSSDSVPTSDSDSPGGYNRAKMRKKSCLEDRKSRFKSMDALRKRHLLDVFQRNYDNLVTMIKLCPLSICGKLFSKGYISGARSSLARDLI